MYYGIDVETVLSPRFYTRLDLEDAMGPNHKFRLTGDGHAYLAAGNRTVAGFRSRSLELKLVARLNCVDAE